MKLKELMNLDGKTALVTGGAGYLGTAICETLAELGANIVIASRTEEKCKVLADRLTKEYEIKAHGIAMDILDPDSVRSGRSFINENFGPVDILVNNAWSGKKNTFESISFEDWDYDINMCLNSVFKTTKIFFEDLSKTQGVVLNTSSMYGHVAPDHRIYDGDRYANPPSYGAAKAGVIQLTKYMASFLSPHKIRVNSLAPGPFPFPETIKENSPFIDRLAEKTILNRIGEPNDLKGAVALLCTNASSYMTGQNICVDGGWAVW